jgi:hypothetical protein
MALITKGFLNTRQLNRHFAEHGADFGASNSTDYELMADKFLGGSKPAGTHECTRSKGDILRYDPATDVYGVLSSGGIIRTFFKPIPCSSVPARTRAAVTLAGRCHSHANNLQYFQAECKKW